MAVEVVVEVAVGRMEDLEEEEVRNLESRLGRIEVGTMLMEKELEGHVEVTAVEEMEGEALEPMATLG